MDELDAKEDEIVYVPVPRRLLPAFYQALAAAWADVSSGDPPAQAGTTKRNLIDLIVRVASGIGADRHTVSLTELYDAYMRAYPGIGKGTTRGSFDATINFHCINMRSRFPDVADKRKPAYWLSRPAFKRVARARYMLLSAEEIARFRRCVEMDNPLIYEDEYEVASLALYCNEEERSE